MDGVSDVCNVSEGDLKAAPEFGSAVSVDYVKGLSTVNDEMVILLDIDHLLNSKELADLPESEEE